MSVLYHKPSVVIDFVANRRAAYCESLVVNGVWAPETLLTEYAKV